MIEWISEMSASPRRRRGSENIQKGGGKRGWNEMGERESGQEGREGRRRTKSSQGPTAPPTLARSFFSLCDDDDEIESKMKKGAPPCIHTHDRPTTTGRSTDVGSRYPFPFRPGSRRQIRLPSFLSCNLKRPPASITAHVSERTNCAEEEEGKTNRRGGRRVELEVEGGKTFFSRTNSRRRRGLLHRRRRQKFPTLARGNTNFAASLFTYLHCARFPLPLRKGMGDRAGFFFSLVPLQ